MIKTVIVAAFELRCTCKIVFTGASREQGSFKWFEEMQFHADIVKNEEPYESYTWICQVSNLEFLWSF